MGFQWAPGSIVFKNKNIVKIVQVGGLYLYHFAFGNSQTPVAHEAYEHEATLFFLWTSNNCHDEEYFEKSIGGQNAPDHCFDVFLAICIYE